jgi:eukaryotic-like serine/threonine-protein kinase
VSVVVTVAEGPDLGQELSFDTDATVIIGRDDPTSDATVRLSDPYLSRQHVALEVRSDTCQLRDLGSTNHTFVERPEGWERVQAAELRDGDRVRVGHTVLAIRVVSAGTATRLDTDPSQTRIDRLTAASGWSGLSEVPSPGPGTQDTPEAAGDALSCLRCGGPLDVLRLLSSASMTSSDLLCQRCQALEAQERSAARQTAPAASCQGCGRDIGDRAATDGRATELAAVALYLCDDCAQQRRRLPSRTIGRYRLLQELGRGGFGVVYLGRDEGTGRLAAIKQQLQRVQGDERLGLRFLREQAIMHELVHPGIVRLYEVGSEDRLPYLASEFAPDGNIGRFIGPDGSPRLQPSQVVDLVADALASLTYVHARGFVHRDLKPENILLVGHDGRLVPKLCDLGLARSYAKHGGTFTRPGESAGTVLYMPPEQVDDFSRCGPPADVYAMGVVTFYLLSGQLPLGFPPPWQMAGSSPAPRMIHKDPMLMALEDPRERLGRYRPDLPAALLVAVDRATRPAVADRWPTADAFRDALLAALPGGRTG